MSKISTIKITNFKAIGKVEADFKGCTAIITAGNQRGKTSFLRGIPDRIRFIRPDVMVKEGEESGKGEMMLTSGEKFIWEFDVKGKDKLIYVTEDGIKASVTTELGARFFPPTFDIDKFLQSPPKKQAQQLQQILGIDFTDIDRRYEVAYGDRTEKNRDAEKYHVKLSQMLKVDKVERVDLSELQGKKEVERARLNKLYLENKAHNDDLRKKYEQTKNTIREQCEQHNKEQADERVRYNSCCDCASILKAHGFTNDSLEKFLNLLRAGIKPNKVASELYPSEPTYIEEMPSDIELQAIDKQILDASATNAEAQKYEDYIIYKKATEAAKEVAGQADQLVQNIEAERRQMIESAKFPKGISITSEGITIDGLPLNREQVSTSKIYTTALRISAMGLGEVKTLYFDASPLDEDSLAEIEKWAEENDLQLLIEIPVRGKGEKEIRYELIQTL